MRRAVIFDYNGVIVNDEPIQFAALQRVLESYQVPLDRAVFDRMCLGRTSVDGILGLKAYFEDGLRGVSCEALDSLRSKAYDELRRDQDFLCPGLLHLIKELKPRYLLAVVTSSSMKELFAALEKFEIRHEFRAIVTADDVSIGKPHPQGYLLALRRLGIDASRAVAIEDSPTGIKAAKSAGIACVAVSQTARPSELRSADFIVSTILDVTIELIETAIGR